MNEKISIKIKWLRFLCALVIITDYSFDYIGYGIKDKGIVENALYWFTQLSTKALTWVAMALFFSISSYLMFLNWNKKKDITTWFRNKIINRIRSLLVPYICWNTIWTILFIAVGRTFSGTNIDTSFTVGNILSGIFLGKFNEIFWFMQVLLILSVLSPVLGVLAERIKEHMLIIAAIFAFSLMMLLKSGPLVMMRNYYCVFFYSLGVYFAVNHQDDVVMGQKNSKVLSGIMLLCSLLGLQLIKTPNNIYNVTQGIGMLVFTVIGVIAFWEFLEVPRIIEQSNWGGSCSFMLYAMHKPIQQLWNKIIAKLFAPSLLGHLINLYGGLIFTVVIVLGIVAILKKGFPRMYHVLNGTRM